MRALSVVAPGEGFEPLCEPAPVSVRVYDFPVAHANSEYVAAVEKELKMPTWTEKK